MPAYNEEKRIGYTLNKYISYFKRLKDNNKLDFEILVVINNTNDRTEEIVKEFANKYNEIIYLNFERGGKDFALIEGFKNALKRNNDLIGFVDSDCATPPNAYYDLIKNMDGYDGVIADRKNKNSVISPKQNLYKIVRGRIFNILIRVLFLFPYRDTQCGAKLFTKETIKNILPRLGISNWCFDVEILFYCRQQKLKINSIPTIWSDIEGSNFDGIKIPGRMFFSIVRLRLYYSPLHFIVLFHGKLPTKLKISYWLRK